MCTLTVIPNKELIITVNRDESPNRAAAAPVVKELTNGSLWLAPEPFSGSSNLIYNITNRRLAVLLNGAFKHHQRKPTYRKSRGEVILDSFSFESLKQMSVEYDFSGIEPFTLVTIDKMEIYELRWDELIANCIRIDSNEPLIWSSTMMYRDEWQVIRKGWFLDFIKEKTKVSAQDMMWFHSNAGSYNPENALVMNRMDMVKTVSTTQVIIGNSNSEIVLIDRISKKTYQEQFNY